MHAEKPASLRAREVQASNCLLQKSFGYSWLQLTLPEKNSLWEVAFIFVVRIVFSVHGGYRDTAIFILLRFLFLLMISIHDDYFGLACSLRKASNVLSESYCQNGPAILAQAWVLVPWKIWSVFSLSQSDFSLWPLSLPCRSCALMLRRMPRWKVRWKHRPKPSWCSPTQRQSLKSLRVPFFVMLWTLSSPPLLRGPVHSHLAQLHLVPPRMLMPCRMAALRRWRKMLSWSQRLTTTSLRKLPPSTRMRRTLRLWNWLARPPRTSPFWQRAPTWMCRSLWRTWKRPLPSCPLRILRRLRCRRNPVPSPSPRRPRGGERF